MTAFLDLLHEIYEFEWPASIGQPAAILDQPLLRYSRRVFDNVAGGVLD